MLDLVKFLVKTNIEFILKNSYLNCHVEGLHSILFVDSPNLKIRMFVAELNHQLHKNFMSVNLKNSIFYPDKELSLAFHPHRFDLTIKVIRGNIFNTIIDKCPKDFPRAFLLNSYNYTSKILSPDNYGFSFLEKDLSFYVKKYKSYSEGSIIYLDADSLHTVAVCKDNIAAWFVFEGNSYNFDNVVYSNTHPEIHDNFYLPMTNDKLYDLLKLSFKCKF